MSSRRVSSPRWTDLPDSVVLHLSDAVRSLYCLRTVLLGLLSCLRQSNQSTQNKPSCNLHFTEGHCFARANCFFSLLMSDTVAFACTKGEGSHLSGREMLGGINGRMRIVRGCKMLVRVEPHQGVPTPRFSRQ
jgi:hypothetical protein